MSRSVTPPGTRPLDPGSPPAALVLSCEHAGNRLPPTFPRPDDLLDALSTHRGWDLGALKLARRIARRLGAPLRFTTLSRLVVDTNRSENGPDVFSPWSAVLPPPERRRLIARHHRPHRARVRRMVEEASEGGRIPVVHVGVHTFTPVLDGIVRGVEVGILLDPARPRERAVAERWMKSLLERAPRLRVALNDPYDGRSDGLTTTLRSRFAQGGVFDYAGLELEVNQGLLEGSGRRGPALAPELADALADALGEAVTAPPRP